MRMTKMTVKLFTITRGLQSDEEGRKKGKEKNRQKKNKSGKEGWKWRQGEKEDRLPVSWLTFFLSDGRVSQHLFGELGPRMMKDSPRGKGT